MDRFLLLFLAVELVGYSCFLAFFAKMYFEKISKTLTKENFWTLLVLVLPPFFVFVTLPQEILILSVPDGGGALIDLLEEHILGVLLVWAVAHALWLLATTMLVARCTGRSRRDSVAALGFALLAYVGMKVGMAIV